MSNPAGRGRDRLPMAPGVDCAFDHQLLDAPMLDRLVRPWPRLPGRPGHPAIAALMTKRRYADEGRGAFVPEADDLDAALIFEGGEYASTAPAFTGGELLTWYGGGRARPAWRDHRPRRADLRVHAIFGGVQLVVPRPRGSRP